MVRRRGGARARNLAGKRGPNFVILQARAECCYLVGERPAPSSGARVVPVVQTQVGASVDPTPLLDFLANLCGCRMAVGFDYRSRAQNLEPRGLCIAPLGLSYWQLSFTAG